MLNYHVGTQVWVVGGTYPLGSNPPWVVTFTVDGQSPASLLTAPNPTSQQLGVYLYASPKLSADDEHELTLKVTAASANAPFVFQEVVFAPSNPSPTTTQSQVVYTATTPPQVTVTVSSSPLPSAKSSSPSTGAIVGGVAAGVAVLAIIGILLFYWFRKRRNGKPYFYESANAGELLKDDRRGE